MNAATMN